MKYFEFNTISFGSKYKKYKVLALTLALVVLLIIVCLVGYLVYKTYNRIHHESFTDTVVNPEDNNVFMYWVGPVPEFIMYLRKLIYLHSQNQSKYKIHLINRESVLNYIDEIPECFDKLKPAHQADYVRVAAVCKYGGIWLDSDTIVMNDLSSMFAKLKEHDGFFVTEDDGLFNGVFGSKANTPLMVDWFSKIKDVLREKKENINWTDIGSGIINDYKNKPEYNELIKNYFIYDGPKSIYPVLWHNAADLFVSDPQKIKQYEKEDQPIIVLFWSTIIKIKPDIKSTTGDIFNNKNTVIGHFINKSMNTLEIDYNYLQNYPLLTG